MDSQLLSPASGVSRSTSVHTHTNSDDHLRTPNTATFVGSRNSHPGSIYFKDASARSSSVSLARTVRDSTHLIPSISDSNSKKFHPVALWLPVAIGTPILMFALGIGLEVALIISKRDSGFSVPKNNALSFVSAQFLVAFVPTILIMPVAILWRELDFHVRILHPYVGLSRGNARAEDTITSDYVTIGVLGSIINSSRSNHRLVFWSAVLSAATYGLQPLAGALFQIQTLPKGGQWATVTSLKSIGLAPDIAELNAFVAAAGFAEAAVANALPDPPFIHGGWAVAEYVFPTAEFLNGSMQVNTTSIQSATNCVVPSGIPQLNTDATTGNFTMTATSSASGCTVNVTFSPKSASQQYGVTTAGCNANANVTLQPVMFWFFHNNTRTNTAEARAVFCSPTIKAFNVYTEASLNNNALIAPPIILNDYVTSNNVTGGNQAGQAFNGVLFDPSPDTFVQARATSISSGISGAIFRAASQQPGGPQTEFDNGNSFLDLTSRIYLQHLSLSAKAIYFVNDNSTIPSETVSLLPRLVINPITGHILAVVMISVGILGLILQIIHRRQRKNLFLAAPPGSIASTMALTSHSGFGELLMPHDSEEMLQRKLSGLRFSMDRRTGAVIADSDEAPSTAKMEKERDETMTALLGGKQSKTDVFGGSSSGEAYAAASGYPPYQAQYPNPYEKPDA